MMPTQPPLYIVDAFTDQPFAGNPAAVCLLLEEAPDSWMQDVAAEMNLSETAFVWPQPGGFALRWYTPAAEVELCGHATLAAAHVLWERNLTQATELLYFHTRYRGGLTCTRTATGMIGIGLPIDVPQDAAAPEGLLDMLGAAEAVNTARGRDDWLIELPDEQAVRDVQPDFAALRSIETRGIAVTARSDNPDFDFVSRFFAPRLRVNEDPVTGSSHCTLGPYWQARLHKDEMLAQQVSTRGGRLRVHVMDNIVELAGHAVTIVAGQMENVG